MSHVVDNISTFVRNQFPAFYLEEGPEFVAFVTAYYEWLEEEGNTINTSRNLLDYQNIDLTSQQFLERFKRTYLDGIPSQLSADPKLTIKNIFDFYRSKGSPRSIELLFRILFNDAASVKYPSEDVLRLSNANYVRPRYIEVYAPDLDNLKSLIGKEIVGATSGAKAFVESIATKLLNRRNVHVIFLSNLRGNFLREEVIAPADTGLTDDMPQITGSLSSINITLGGSNNAVGDTFVVQADEGKLGLARVTSIANATGLVSYTLANGGFGFTTNTLFTDIDVNDNHLIITDRTNIAQTYTNSSFTESADFLRFETVEQKLETITYLSGLDLSSDIQDYIVTNESGPLIEGRDSSGTLIANGYVVNTNINGANGSLLISPRTGTFGEQKDLTITLANATHSFLLNEYLDEENEVELTVTGINGTFNNGDLVVGNSGANGIVSSTNATHIVVNGSFGVWSTDDTIIVSGDPTVNADVQGVSVAVSGANGKVSFANSTTLSVSDIVGAWTQNKKIRGRRSQAIATIDTGGVADTGVSDINISGNLNSNAVVDTYSNDTITAVVIGFAQVGNRYEIGTTDTIKASTGQFAYFNSNAASFIRGRDSNTYANVVTVGTGTGSTFKIGLLENEEDITIYTDFIGDNNTANVSYLDCVIDGGNSGIGFLDSVTINDGGTGYTNGQAIVFNGGGPGGGPPTDAAYASVTTDNSGVVLSITVTDQGSGFYTSSSPDYSNMPGGSDLDVTGNFDFGYGFPKDPDGDYTTILDNVLTRYSGTIGTIATLKEINPGNNYNFDPFVSVYTKGIANYDRRDIIVNLIDKNGTFVIGETVNQTVSQSGQVLFISNTNIHYANGGSDTGNTSSFEVGDTVKQQINATVQALGEVYLQNSTSISLINVRKREDQGGGSYLYIDTTNNVPFVSATAIDNLVINTAANVVSINATVDSTQTVSRTQTAKGQVYSQTDTSVSLRRLSFSVGFNNLPGSFLVGSTSGANGTIDSVIQDSNTRPIGDNADITARTQAADGIVTGVEILDSGFGYTHNANVTLISSNTEQNIVVSGQANVTLTGIGQGYWTDQESFLNTKYLHDNNYYQEYAYVVRSGLSLDKYRDILLEVAHVAGTKMFGQLDKQSFVSESLTVSNSSITIGATHSNGVFEAS